MANILATKIVEALNEKGAGLGNVSEIIIEGVLKKEKTYTEDEVTKLLAAYTKSDYGYYSVEEVKSKHPNSFDSHEEAAKNWLDTIALKTIKERANAWFEFQITKDFGTQLKRRFAGKSITEIYITVMLKL